MDGISFIKIAHDSQSYLKNFLFPEIKIVFFFKYLENFNTTY